MATIRHQCPHCLVNDVALVASAWTVLTGDIAFAHLTCPRCQFPSAAEIMRVAQTHVAVANLAGHGGDPTTQGWSVRGFWPEPPSPIIPEYLPPGVQRVLIQAERNFADAGNEDAAGSMYRKALDVGLKQVDPNRAGSLAARIDALAKAGQLTPDVAEWAHRVRMLGNEAVHEEEPPSRADIEDLRGITEMVLRYLFTLPEMVRRRREAAPPQT